PGEIPTLVFVECADDVVAAEQDYRQGDQEAHSVCRHVPLNPPGSVPSPAKGHGLYECQVSVHADHHQEEDAAGIVHGYGRPLESLSHGHSPERQAHSHDQVGRCQVAEVDIGHSEVLAVQAEHTEDEGVAH
uniref:Uncharacterized protein n=1 Tax=Scleropages formosus TaxID=113540 RepID=A0A8C9R7E4_SCLFO